MGDISIKGHSPILRQGYKDGGRAGFSVGSSVGRHLKKGVGLVKEHLARKEDKKVQAAKDKIQKSEMGYAKGGKAKKDKRWIQKATASIKKRGTKGKCTPITKPGCTGRAKALAKTFKKMAKKRKAG